jgi:SAM-dependent methyltransferase
MGAAFNFRSALNRKHPFDIDHDTDTSGYVSRHACVPDRILAKKLVAYEAVQPSIVRQALRTLPHPSRLKEYCFIDIGCGKGRALIVASEFPFCKVVGIEISSRLAGIARKNSVTICRKFPLRPKIDVVVGNAIDVPLANRKIVMFLYNPFHAELMAQLLGRIESGLKGPIEHMFIVYHNPVAAHVFDFSTELIRWHVAKFSCEPSEHGYGYPSEGATIIWQSKSNAIPTPHSHPDRLVFVTNGKSTRLAPFLRDG